MKTNEELSERWRKIKKFALFLAAIGNAKRERIRKAV